MSDDGANQPHRPDSARPLERRSELTDRVQAWIADEVDPLAADDLRALLAADDQPALAERFDGTLTFGTAGLRGPLRAGPNGMNRAVVRRAAAGLAAWLAAHGHAGERVVVGYDGRHGSLDFAQDSASIFGAAGFRALLLPRLLPTPVLAFAVRHLGAAAGVMVTASHNPPQDNGYKVYAHDGAQIVPPTDAEIEAAIQAVGPTKAIDLDPSRVTILDESIVEAYITAVAGLVALGPRELRIVHTAMHGVGTEMVTKVFDAARFEPLIKVPEQAAPDPDFPTVAFPNPEEPGALDLALALAREHDADIVIANDPDADRCAVAARFPSGWQMLRGDQVGVLLADALLRKGIKGTYATTIVSSSMMSAMAERHGVGYVETLTGFKWIARSADDLAFGYEEALGYAVAPDVVRDKDGISAALVVAELAAALKLAGSSLPERLDELAAEYGRYVTDQISIRVDDLSIISDAMARLRSAPPARLLDEAVEVEDLLPDADVLRFRITGGRVVVRPSGTEPKLKAYLEVVVPDGSAAVAAQRLQQLRAEMCRLLPS
jgi:phosphomannomutase